ncbi:MAG: DUF1730 domain-containing protein [Clostridiales bacterium]|nr:DUF1730 domain-containing protein [Clostridiales bacterium]
MTTAELFAQSGAAAWGTCAFVDLRLSPESRQKALTLCPEARGVYVAAYPYFAGDRPGNLSLYARGADYHQSLLRRLRGVAEQLALLHPEHRFVPGTDSSPLDERQCAWLAGVGVLGRNGLVIVEPYGSWVFLGTVLTDLPLPSAAVPAPDCIGCGACVRACPGGALDSLPFDESKCLSALTQKKGQLTADEEVMLAAHPLIWGCDLCQQVCPYNRDAALSLLTDLTGQDAAQPYLPSLAPEDLEGLSNRTFREKYGGRAFAWRGPGVLRRNLALKRKKGE